MHAGLNERAGDVARAAHPPHAPHAVHSAETQQGTGAEAQAGSETAQSGAEEQHAPQGEGGEQALGDGQTGGQPAHGEVNSQAEEPSPNQGELEGQQALGDKQAEGEVVGSTSGEGQETPAGSSAPGGLVGLLPAPPSPELLDSALQMAKDMLDCLKATVKPDTIMVRFEE